MKTVISLILLLVTFTSYADNVRLFFTNNTSQKFKPLAVINYNKDKIAYEKYIEPDHPIIDAYAQNVKIDQDHLGISNYYLIWFELNDENNRYQLSCLDSYIAITRSSDIYFTLSPDDDFPHRNVCTYKIVPR